MKASENTASAGYLFLLAGFGLAFVSALIPHFYTGYNLNIGVLAAGITPWLVYGMVLVLIRNAMTVVMGLILALAHAWLVLSQRFGEANPYSDNLIYIAPLVVAVLLVPFATQALVLAHKQMMTPAGPVADEEVEDDKET